MCSRWIALYVKNVEITYFDCFGVGRVPEEIEKFIGHKNNSITCKYFCIEFIDFILKGKALMKLILSNT